MPQSDLSRIITEFTVELVTVMERMVTERIQAAVDGVFTPSAVAAAGRPADALAVPAPPAPRQRRTVPGKRVKKRRAGRRPAKKRR